MGGSAHSRVVQMRWCAYAYAVAADRDDTSSLVKMLLRCRATVFSLMNSSVATARLVLPTATIRAPRAREG